MNVEVTVTETESTDLIAALSITEERKEFLEKATQVAFEKQKEAKTNDTSLILAEVSKSCETINELAFMAMNIGAFLVMQNQLMAMLSDAQIG